MLIILSIIRDHVSLDHLICFMDVLHNIDHWPTSTEVSNSGWDRNFCGEACQLLVEGDDLNQMPLSGNKITLRLLVEKCVGNLIFFPKMFHICRKLWLSNAFVVTDIVTVHHTESNYSFHTHTHFKRKNKQEILKYCCQC